MGARVHVCTCVRAYETLQLYLLVFHIDLPYWDRMFLTPFGDFLVPLSPRRPPPRTLAAANVFSVSTICHSKSV